MLNTQRYLQVAGIGGLILALTGYTGLGPTPGGSLAGDYLFFDPTETLFHILLAAVCLLALWRLKSERSLRIASGLVGVVLLVVSVVAWLNWQAPAPNVGIFHLEPIDALVHTAIALWGFWVAFMPEGPMFVRNGQLAKTNR
jgi:hypothetical protein